MSLSQQSAPAQQAAEVKPAVSPQRDEKLRLWPAVLLFLLLAVTRLAVYVMAELPPALFPMVFFGPMVATFLVSLWWLFASRARIRDRWLGFLVLVAAGVASFWLAHPTVQGPVYMFFVMPIAVAAFLIALFVLARFGRGVATWAAVLVGVACFAGSLLARSNGFSGDFRVAVDWRWQPNAEDQYLAALQKRGQDPTATSKGPDPVFAKPIGTATWPEFRGPKRDGSVSGIRLDENWTAHPPREIWRHKVGPGWSSFAATSTLIYTQEQRGDAEAVVCYDAKTGSEVWCYLYPSRFEEAMGGPGPRATPTLHDGALFTLGAKGVLCRLDARNGAMAWTRDLCKDADRKQPMWGFSSSPLVANGLVIVHAGGKDNKGILAYDEKTGDPRWAPAGDHSYSSPHFATVLGEPCVLMLTNTGLGAYDPLTGKSLWEHEWKYQNYRALQPLVLGDDSLLLGTGLGGGTRRIDLKQDGSAVKITERYTTLAMKPGFNDFVAHRGHLYGFDANVFACLDLETGARKWKEGRYGTGQVLLLPDHDQLLVVAEQPGDLVLLRANPERHEELARFSALNGKTWNHPILVGNRLYLRNSEEAACFELTLAK